MDRPHVLEEIRRTAKANGGIPLGRQRFLAETGIRESDWIGRFWVRWSDAVREAGFEPNARQAALDGGRLLERLGGLVRELGYYPVSAELRMKARADPEFPSHNTFGRFGRKERVALALVKWCESNPGWEDVQAICTPVAVRAVSNEVSEKEVPSPELGYVYLLKSGKFTRSAVVTRPAVENTSWRFNYPSQS